MPSGKSKRKSSGSSRTSSKRSKKSRDSYQTSPRRLRDEDDELVWDPENSYVVDDPQESEIRPKRQRWRHSGPPIMNIKDTPDGWNDEEPDLDPR